MAEETEDYETIKCWSCGEQPAYECSRCDDGEEYCGDCLSEHEALKHDADDDA